MKTTVKVMLDQTLLNEKPQGAAIGAVQKRLASGACEIEIKELATLLSNGATFKPAYLSGTTNDTWESQSLFALDFDNGVPFNEVMAFSNAMGLTPSFAYTSFSHLVDKDGTGAKERFRIVFRTENEVTDARLRNAIQLALMTIFSECDEACKDATRLFFGGRTLLHLDEAALLDPAYLIAEALPSYLKSNDPHHYSRDLKTYCERVGLNMFNALPDVEVVEIAEDSEELGENDAPLRSAKVGEFRANSIIYYRTGRELTKKCTFAFNIDDASNFKVGRGGKMTIKKAKVEAEKENFDLIRHFDFEALENNCMLYHDFVNGEFWPNYEQVKAISTNLCAIKGGQSKVLEALELYKEQYPSTYSYYNAVNCVTNMAKYGYAPMRCANFNCPYYDQCENETLNMIQAASNTSKTSIVELKDEIEYQDLDEAYEAAVEAMKDYLTAEETEETSKQDSLFLLIGPTGVGKTTMLRDLQEVHGVDFSNTVICLPTHNTVKDVYPRVCQDNYVVALPLELEDEDVLAKFNQYRNVGDYGRARRLIQDSFQILPNDSEELRARKRRDKERAQAYLNTEKEIRTTSKTIFCTHKKALNLNNRNVETLIVDEDILMSGLFEQVTLNEKEIRTALAIAKQIDLKVIAGAMQKLLDVAEEARKYPMHIITMPAKAISDKELRDFTDASDGITFDIRKYLNIQQVIADKNAVVVSGSYKVELPYKKVIVMSATAYPSVYKAFLPNTNVIVHDMGYIRTAGTLIHHHMGTSRQAMRQKGQRLIDRIKKEAKGVTNIISFKEQQRVLEKNGFNFICNFGNCTGIDAYKGQDLIVVGTPHVNNVTYALLAATIRPNINIIQDFEVSPMKKNGFKFCFNTFKDIQTETGSLLHTLQMYYIETEIVQAIGRARLLRERCTVHLFSNLPQRGSKLYR